MNARPAVSLVVATRNRPTDLGNFLSSLEKSHVRPQVIIVDQSDSEVAPANRALAEAARAIRPEYFRSSTRGLSRARNEGLQLVRGEIVGFPDDDCTYPQSLLADAIAELQRDHELTFVVGSYFQNLALAPKERRYKSINAWNAFAHANSITLFVRISNLTPGALRFNEVIGAGTELPLGEETDLVLRMIRSGHKGRWYSHLLAAHPPNIRNSRTSDDLRIQRAYGYLMGLNAPHPLIILRAALGFLKLLLASVFSSTYRRHLRARFDGFCMSHRNTKAS